VRAGRLLLQGTGAFTYTPDVDEDGVVYVGNDSFRFKVNDGQVDVAAQAFPDPARLGERLSLDRLLEVRLLFEHDRENFSEQAEVLHDQSLAHLRTPTIVPPFSEAATLPSVHPM